MPLSSDPDFQEALIVLTCKDRLFLKSADHLLDPKDLHAHKSKQNGLIRWITFQTALDYYHKYEEPIGRMLPLELKKYLRISRMDGEVADKLIEYGRQVVKRRASQAESVIDNLLSFKKETARESAINKLVDLYEAGKLDDEAWHEAFDAGMLTVDKNPFQSSDYFALLDTRIERRDHFGDDRYPVLMIDPLDSIVRAIARKQLGLVVAPWKRGKSMMLLWIALAYCIQRLNVLYVTLEDPKDEVEDRIDANVAGLPLKSLRLYKKTLRIRFARYKAAARNRLRILDGTEKGFTVSMIEQAIEKHRREGFLVDAVIIDYDDEIVARKKQQDRHLELAQIYRDLRQLAAKKDLFLWTAAQTRRGTEGVKILSGASLADDVSKIRKVSFALSLGQGDWGDDSIFLWVAAHRYDRQHVGVNIMSCKERMLIYDRERTHEEMKKKHHGTEE